MCDGGWARLTARAWLRSPRSWDTTNLPTNVRGVWLYLYLVIDVWSRKVVAWDGADREDPAVAAAVVSRRQPLILHAYNGKALAAGFREAMAGRHA